MYFGIYIQGESIQNSIIASPKVWGITLVKEILNVDKKIFRKYKKWKELECAFKGNQTNSRGDGYSS